MGERERCERNSPVEPRISEGREGSAPDPGTEPSPYTLEGTHAEAAHEELQPVGRIHPG